MFLKVQNFNLSNFTEKRENEQNIHKQILYFSIGD